MRGALPGLVVAAAVLPGMLAYPAYSFTLRELGAGKTALVLFLGPVYADFSCMAAKPSEAAGVWVLHSGQAFNLWLQRPATRKMRPLNFSKTMTSE